MSSYLALTGTNGKSALFALVMLCAAGLAALGGTALADGHDLTPSPEGVKAAETAFVGVVDRADNDTDADDDADGIIVNQGQRVLANLDNANRWINWQKARAANGLDQDTDYPDALAAQTLYQRTLAACQALYGDECSYAELDGVSRPDVQVRIRAELSDLSKSITVTLQENRGPALGSHRDIWVSGAPVTPELDGYRGAFRCLGVTEMTLVNNRTVQIAVKKESDGDFLVQVVERNRAGRCVEIEGGTPYRNRVPTNARDGRPLLSSVVSISEGPFTQWHMDME